jgi:Mlc titration factor MtfA (ptsG expression regulator)
MQFIVLTIALFLAITLIYAAVKKKKPLPQPEGGVERDVLRQHVLFYQQLTTEQKTEFENRVRNFLQKVRITGVKTAVSDADRVFVAAAATIPIFAFKDWEYRNIHEVLVYPGSFSEDFHVNGDGRDVLGMVGNGPMQDVMILSQQDLRNGFLQEHTSSNTAIHEFVHLIDKTDGDMDGSPRILLPPQYALPWLKRMHEEIRLIQTGRSDINPYGATNETEFLAVAAEYFFGQPHRMQQNHPDLYKLLQEIFTPIKEA